MEPQDHPRSEFPEPLWFYVLSHHTRDALHRTIHVQVGSREIYLCTRCTAKYLGLIMVFVGNMVWYPVFLGLQSSPPVLILGSFLPLPVFLAWFHQKLTGKNNSTPLRVVTGLLMGWAEGFLAASLVFGPLPLLLYWVGVFAAYGIATFVILFLKKIF